MNFPHALGRLPTDLHPPVETALAEAEAIFRETLVKNKPRSWSDLRSAIRTAMTASFDAFHRQACLGVQRGGLAVSDARSGAEEFLEGHARSIHDWLVSLMQRYSLQSPYSFRRYNSNDEFVFSRDMVEMMQSSVGWTQFLRDLAKCRESGEPSTEFPVSPELLKRRQGWLKSHRKAHGGMTVPQLAARLGTNARAIQAVAKGDRQRYSNDTQEKLLKEIGVSRKQWYGEG